MHDTEDVTEFTTESGEDSNEPVWIRETEILHPPDPSDPCATDPSRLHILQVPLEAQKSLVKRFAMVDGKLCKTSYDKITYFNSWEVNVLDISMAPFNVLSEHVRGL